MICKKANKKAEILKNMNVMNIIVKLAFYFIVKRVSKIKRKKY